MCSLILGGLWIVCSIGTVAFGGLLCLESVVPKFLLELAQYGKTQTRGQKWSIVSLIEVPKGCFTHFYVVGVLINGYMTFVLARYYIFNIQLPNWIETILLYVQANQQVSTDSLSALILVSLMFIQDIRRLYECLFINSYSNSKINVIHYAFGILIYSTFSFVVLSEAPRPTLNDASLQHGVDYMMSQFSWRHINGLILFFFASFNQHVVNRQFASFRCNNKGQVVTLKHMIPHGGWFELVSCPHYTMEMLIYLSFLLIGGFSHMTLFTVAVIVFCNQTMAAFMSHNWYRKQFKDYPKNRKAVIPFLF